MELYFGETCHMAPLFLEYQKKAIRIMEGCGKRVLCRNLFKKLQILPLTSQCVLFLLMYVVQKKKFFLNKQ